MSLRKLWPPGGYRLTKKWKIEALKLELQALKAELVARKNLILIPATIDSIEDQQKFLELIRLFKPVRVANIRKVRVGRSGDGGYVMLDCFDEIDTAFSFGVEQEISWDTEMAMRGCNVYMYDHSIDAPPQSNPRFHFFKKMIGPREDSSMGVESIENVLAKHGASGRRNVLKIDIEGAEWDAFDATEASILDRFSQIVCEFHGFENGVNDLWLARAVRVLSKLKQSHEVAHIHGNNYAPLTIIGNIALPSVLEVTFINRNMFETVSSSEPQQSNLDFPNFKERPDYIFDLFSARN